MDVVMPWLFRGVEGGGCSSSPLVLPSPPLPSLPALSHSLCVPLPGNGRMVAPPCGTFLLPGSSASPSRLTSREGSCARRWDWERPWRCVIYNSDVYVMFVWLDLYARATCRRSAWFGALLCAPPPYLFLALAPSPSPSPPPSPEVHIITVTAFSQPRCCRRFWRTPATEASTRPWSADWR